MSQTQIPEVLPAPISVTPLSVEDLLTTYMPVTVVEVAAAPTSTKGEQSTATRAAIPEVYPEATAAAPPAGKPSALAPLIAFVRFLVGWTWRWVVGAVMCFNTFILSWLTAVVAMGWTNRVVQSIVLRCWFWRSPLRKHMTFAAFCDTLGPDAPVARPRWFWQERILQSAAQPRAGGKPAGPFTLLYRMFFWPWHSLWFNFKVGFKAAYCTAVLLAVPCLFMVWSWEQGWINSFHGGYEQAWFGPVFGIVGILLFCGAMLYVPMAQTHQAVTGQARAFFDFRFVWHLVRARLTGYVVLAVAIGFWSFILNILRALVLGENFGGNAAETAEQGLQAFRVYLFFVSLAMFPVYVLLRVYAGLVYQSAVLKVVRRGIVTHAELHPTLRQWFEQLQLGIVPVASGAGITWYARLSARWTYRRVLFVTLFLLWFAFMVRFYFGYFLVYDPFVGPLNHPLVQIPCFDYIPAHLYQGRDF